MTPGSTLSFAGGTPFTVAGVPIARNAALIGAGMTRQIADRTMFDLSYAGEIASRVQDHSFSARLTGAF